MIDNQQRRELTKSIDVNGPEWANLQNAFMWPINLVRDFPKRFGRLLATLVTIPTNGEYRSIGSWLHAVSCYIFDLMGGPEIAQFLIRMATDTRPLTEAEIATAKDVLGDRAIRYGDIRIAQKGVLDLVFRMNGNRAFATWHTINMPVKPQIDMALLVHELTHVFQYERVGTVYIGQGLRAQRMHGHAAYHYGGSEGLDGDWSRGKRFRDFNREQQGQIAQDYCARRQANKDTAAYDPFIEELRSGLV